MAGVAKTSEGSHWYAKDGTPMHKVPYAASNKKKAGQFRSTTVTDARKMGLVPSVTNVIGIVEKPNLTAWKIDQVLEAAADLVIEAGETKEDWMKRVYEKSREVNERSRDIGHAVHEHMEAYAQGGVAVAPQEIGHVTDPLEDWFDVNVGEVAKTEFTCACDRYAGTIDLVAEVRHYPDPGHTLTIVDYKTRQGGWKQDRHGKWRCDTYLEDQIQLAAYRSLICQSTNTPFDSKALNTMSVLACSTERRSVFAHPWTQEQMDRGLAIFNSLLDTWSGLKDYKP